MKKVYILDDHKPGSMSQSQGVVSLIEGASTTIIPIYYKNQVARALFFVLCHCAWSQKLKYLFLNLCLKDFPSHIIDEEKTIVSAGAISEPVNYLLSDKKTKNIIVMKPIRYKKFDLVFVPLHDKPKKRKNVIPIVGAPSVVTPERAEEKATLLKKELGLPGGPYITLILGGNNAHYHFPYEKIEELLSQLKKLSFKQLITVSRRTPDHVVHAIENYTNINTNAFLIKRQGPDVIAGLIGLASYIAVTSDSVSMISECVQSGKKPFIISLPTKKRSVKLPSFINDLKSRGLVLDQTDFSLEDTTDVLIKDNPYLKDRKTIQKHLGAIL